MRHAQVHKLKSLRILARMMHKTCWTVPPTLLFDSTAVIVNIFWLHFE